MPRNPWLAVTRDAFALYVESCAVVGLRLVQAGAGGRAAQAEAHRMVQEKVEAGLEWHGRAMSGALGATPHAIARETLSFYRRKVRANRKRLMGG